MDNITNIMNTKVDFQPGRQIGVSIIGNNLVYANNNSKIIATADARSIISLPFAATMFINEPGNVRVIPISNNLNISDSVLFKNVQGDFHRIIKGIVLTDTTITDFILDFRETIKIKKY